MPHTPHWNPSACTLRPVMTSTWNPLSLNNHRLKGFRIEVITCLRVQADGFQCGVWGIYFAL
eukprot:1167673-Prorocentrum_minimum.AAC.1